jgi:hypothetical protein
MKDCYAEEIIFSLAFLISMLAFEFGHLIIGYAFMGKAIMDFMCIFATLKNKAKNDIDKQHPEI